MKHEDSFIYLAAINGLCALATSYPQVVVQTLVREYVEMRQRVSTMEGITTETRVKLGEVLVKMTRNLGISFSHFFLSLFFVKIFFTLYHSVGEMAPAYKNILINGFLCATRDTDSLVRASSLSCLGELCKVLGFRLGDTVIEVCIVD